MNTLFQILPEMAAVVAIVFGILFTVLSFRDPFRPQWMQRNWTAVAASLLIAVAVSFGLGLMISGAVSAGIPAGYAILLALAVAGGSGLALVRVLAIGERLRRCDAGQSPFQGIAVPDALRRLWQRQFRGRAGA